VVGKMNSSALHTPEDVKAKLPQKIMDDALKLGKFSRLGRQPLIKQQVATGTIIEQVLCDARQQAKGRTVSVTVGEAPALWGDPSLLKQVFINLIPNAFKYTRTRPETVIEIGSSEIGGERVFFVRDNGAGFDMRYADKLFGVFQRLQSRGGFRRHRRRPGDRAAHPPSSRWASLGRSGG
jgi:hypothetical protein